MGTRSATGDSIRLTLQATIKNVLTDSKSATAQIGGPYLADKLTSGIEDGQINRAWESTGRELLTGVSESFDLHDMGSVDIGAGAGNDALGQAVHFEEVVALAIKQTAGTGRLEIMSSTPAGYLKWAPVLTVANGGALKAGGLVFLYNPAADAFDIADGSSHILHLKANGGPVTYDIMILGKHDDNESSASSASSSSSSSVSSVSSSSSSRSSSSVSSVSSLSTSSSSP